MFVSKRADERLQQRRGELVRQGDQADVSVIEPQLGFQNRVNRGDQRLQRVIDEVRETKREKNWEHRRAWESARVGLVDADRRAVRWRFARRAHGDILNALGAGGENRGPDYESGEVLSGDC